MKSIFCICECFYTNNFFIKKYRCHVKFFSKNQFISEYQELLQSKGCTDLEEVFKEIEDELYRRKNLHVESYKHKCIIKQKYVPLKSSIFTFSESYLNKDFLNLVNTVKNEMPTKDELIKSCIMNNHSSDIYSLPIFTKEYCQDLVKEIKNFESTDLPKTPPNTMNRYGLNLDELGFEELITDLRENYLVPLTNILYPEWGGDFLDSHKAFIVKYKEDEDVDLSYHYDNAEVTLNVSLNDDFEEGELYFGPLRGEEKSSKRIIYRHIFCRGLIHRGQQMHGALPILEGERYNLIIWMRSSKIRNYLCPMCLDTPTLIPVDHGFGDGFRKYEENLCVTT